MYRGWTHKERKEFCYSDQMGFDHHTFYVGYSATDIFFSTMKVAKGDWGLPPEKISRIAFPKMPENALLQTSCN